MHRRRRRKVPEESARWEIVRNIASVDEKIYKYIINEESSFRKRRDFMKMETEGIEQKVISEGRRTRGRVLAIE